MTPPSRGLGPPEAVPVTAKTRILRKILVFFPVSGVIYLGIASVPIVGGRPDRLAKDAGGLVFEELSIDFTDLPDLQVYRGLESLRKSIH